jgi:hypothetical protein
MRRLWVLILGAVLIVPVAQAQKDANLLQNPGFEGAFHQYGPFETAIVPEGWTPWWQVQTKRDPDWRNRMPEFKVAAPYESRIHQGENAQQVFTSYGTHAGGVYQVVDGLTPGSTVRFTVWGHAWAGEGDDPDRSEEGGPMHMMAGIDPTGGTSPYSTRVVWSDDLNPLDEWVMFQVEAVVQGSAVTVFTRSAPEYPTLHNDVYWDEASLTVVAPAPAPTPAPIRYFSYCGEGVGESQPRVPALTR